MLDLRSATPPAWLSAVFSDFSAFLVDHAACEKKAFSNGMALVSRYPERQGLVTPLIAFARDEPDPYAKELRSQVRPHGDDALCDRLLVAGIIEARSCERLCLLADALPSHEPALVETYQSLARAEARHHGLFLRLARQETGAARTEARAQELLDFEAKLVATLPLRAAVH